MTSTNFAFLFLVKVAWPSKVQRKLKNDIGVVLWDSPGLQDGSFDEEKYLEDMGKQLHEDLDVMIYCIKMDDKRFLKSEENSIHALTRKFGKDLWKNAVIALTFANNVKDPDGRNNEEFFCRDFSHWREEIVKFFLRHSGILLKRNSRYSSCPGGTC